MSGGGVQLGFRLFPAEVALPDGRVYERVMVSVTGGEVSVWQAVPPDSDLEAGAVLVWSGTCATDDDESAVPAPGSFTIPTIGGPLEVTWPRLLIASPAGGPR